MSDVESKSVFVTNDMSFAAYLRLKDVRMVNAKKLGRTFKFSFVYESRIEQLKIDYINSESSRHDDEIRKLKKILYSEEV